MKITRREEGQHSISQFYFLKRCPLMSHDNNNNVIVIIIITISQRIIIVFEKY